MKAEAKPIAERGEDLAAGITGPPCPFCLSKQTTAVTDGWPGEGESGEWSCGNCGESGTFDAHGLYWIPEGDSNAQ
jgi:hypothetical protein